MPSRNGDGGRSVRPVCVENTESMRIKSGYKIREIAGEKVIVLQGKYGVDMTRLISLNDSAVWLLEELAGREFEVEDVAALLEGRYEVDAGTAARDAARWTESLVQSGLLETGTE